MSSTIPFRKTVIATMSAKGGVGKSTHTFNMGVYYHHVHKKNVLILDVEKKPALSEVSYKGEKEPGLRFDIKYYFDSQELWDELELLKLRYDIILIDTAGVDVDINGGTDGIAQEAMNEAVLAAADFVVIPVKPSVLDARKTLKFCQALTKWQMARRGALQALAFLNEARVNENLTKEVHKQMAEGLPVEYRDEVVAYTPYIGEAMFRGVSMAEYKSNHAVTLQLASLADEVLTKAQTHLNKLEA
ncbi:ParA family protein [Vibrio navarrensis]